MSTKRTSLTIACPMRAARLWSVALALLVGAASELRAAPNQFVILSDIHPDGAAQAQLVTLTEQLLKLRPAFVVQLGDFMGEPTPDMDLNGLEHAVQMFHRLREVGIDVYPVMGNHDVETGNKIKFLCGHTPPLNPELNPNVNRAVYERWCRDHRYC